MKEMTDIDLDRQAFFQTHYSLDKLGYLVMKENLMEWKRSQCEVHGTYDRITTLYRDDYV